MTLGVEGDEAPSPLIIEVSELKFESPIIVSAYSLNQ